VWVSPGRLTRGLPPRNKPHPRPRSVSSCRGARVLPKRGACYWLLASSGAGSSSSTVHPHRFLGFRRAPPAGQRSHQVFHIASSQTVYIHSGHEHTGTPCMPTIFLLFAGLHLASCRITFTPCLSHRVFTPCMATIVLLFAGLHLASCRITFTPCLSHRVFTPCTLTIFLLFAGLCLDNSHRIFHTVSSHRASTLFYCSG